MVRVTKRRSKSKFGKSGQELVPIQASCVREDREKMKVNVHRRFRDFETLMLL
jgi:hypothetical protein